VADFTAGFFVAVVFLAAGDGDAFFVLRVVVVVAITHLLIGCDPMVSVGVPARMVRRSRDYVGSVTSAVRLRSRSREASMMRPCAVSRSMVGSPSPG
jgi:hypothetical protein